MTGPMASVDAQFYWMSAKLPNDQFLLYAFDGVPADMGAALRALGDRATRCPDLTIRIDDGCGLTYPKWVSAQPDPNNFVHHELADDTWNGCLDAVAKLAEVQLDGRRSPWRMHVFAPVRGTPGSAGPATVVVLQATHSLADGQRWSANASWLFGRPGSPPAAPPATRGWLLARGIEAGRAQRRLTRDTRDGLVPPSGPQWAPLVTNDKPSGATMVRTLVRHRSDMPGPTMTVGVLAAISTALAAHLREWDGTSVDNLGAEVPMAKKGTPLARNSFGNVGVGLYPGLPWAARTAAIAADLQIRRRRREHPAMLAEDRAFACVPAVLLRWGVGHFDPEARSPTVGGNTAVSSVNRGAADLRFDTAPVVLTTGYPALSPMMGLTHGVHGIGETVAISVHAAESAVGDIDAYVRRLASAIGPDDTASTMR